LPREPHDQPLDLIVTEGGTFRCTASGADHLTGTTP